jgi:cytochrome b6-f complex iron-sulfur subunit
LHPTFFCIFATCDRDAISAPKFQPLFNQMTRYEFLKNTGFKGGALMALLTSCETGFSKLEGGAATTNPSPIPTPGSVDFTIDLSSNANASLQKTNGYVITNKIVVAKTADGKYVAATYTCSHEPKNKVIFQSGEFYCTEHGARFTTAGVGLNSDGKKGLSIYKTELKDSKTLRVYA